MKNKITEIFDAVAAADNIEDVVGALKRSAGLAGVEQSEFVTRLRAEFSKISAERQNGFRLEHVHPLNENDLSQGFHICYRGGA